MKTRIGFAVIVSSTLMLQGLAIGIVHTVTSTNDSGSGTLRQALLSATNGDIITFDATIFSPGNPDTITLTSELPWITQGNLTIDAYSKGVILDGSGMETGDGFHIISNSNVIKGLQILNFHDHGIRIDNGASHNLIGGINATPGGACTGDCNVISGNGGCGILICHTGTSHNTISGNYIGTDASGFVAMGNSRYEERGINAIEILDGPSYNVIGGTTPGTRNIVSGNHLFGIVVNGGYNSQIIGNFIGVAPDGTTPLANGAAGAGISKYAAYNVLGGDAPEMCNIIAYSGWFGVFFGNYPQYNDVVGNVIICNPDGGIGLWGDGTRYNTIRGNYIGTNAFGANDLGNFGPGVILFDGASLNVIGVGNIIAFNNSHGVEVSGSSTLYNTITCNSIHNNNGQGIMLNDGGNLELSPPVITNVSANGVVGTISTPFVTIEIFSDDANQGRLCEGNTNADSQGLFSFHKPDGLTGPFLTATCIDNNGNASGFSEPVQLGRCEVMLTSPNGGENWRVGEQQVIAWVSQNTSGNMGISYSTNRGETWETMVTATPDDGTYSWTVPWTFSDSCIVEICDNANAACFDRSDSYFSIFCQTNVTNTLDGGHGSFREALLCANVKAGRDTIEFNILGEGPHSIQPASPLPVITDEIVINGYSQPGAQYDTSSSRDSLNHLLLIELNGRKVEQDGDGLEISAGNSTIRGLVINGFNGHGIHVRTNGGNAIEGNYIGTDVTGTEGLGNIYSGICIDLAPRNNTVGPGNLISFNGNDGVVLRADQTQDDTVNGNILTDNMRDGIRVEAVNVGSTGLTNNTIKRNLVGVHVIDGMGMPAIEGNVIEDNVEAGILVEDGSRIQRKGTVEDDKSILNNVISLNANGIRIKSLSHSVGKSSGLENVLGVFHNNIFSNVNYGLLNENPRMTVVASSNWWGDGSGPYNEGSNPEGEGDAVGENVVFNDWLAEVLVLAISSISDVSGISGSSVEVDFKIYNMRTDRQTYGMTVTDSLGWMLISAESELTLDAFATRVVSIVVTIPEEVVAGTRDKVTLSGISKDNPPVYGSDWAYVQVTKGVRGDINLDSSVDILDVLRVVNIILGIGGTPSEYEYWAADCNGDEAVNILDALGIVNVILEIGTCQP